MAENRIAMTPTLLDRVIGYVAPDRAVRRMKARATMAIIGGYVGGRYDRNSTRTWFTNANSADVDTVYDLLTLRSRSRDLVRNNPIATGAVGTMLTNVIGSGLSLQARPDAEYLKMSDDDAEEWVENVEREFRCWAECPDCDITRTQNFYGLQGLAFRSVLESGDCISLLPMASQSGKSSAYSLRIQLIEADRLATPGAAGIVAIVPGIGGTLTSTIPTSQQVTDPSKFNGATAGNRIVAGVELTQTGAPIAYHIATQHPGDVAASALKWDRVLAFGTKTGRRNVLHMFQRERPGQNRGIPLLAPVIEPLKQLDRYTEAELMAAVVSGMFTVFVKTEGGDGINPGPPVSGSLLASDKKNIGMGNGAIVDLVPGEDVQFANPGRPNTAYDGFVQSILRQIGVALGLPFEVLIKHFTASYSAARAALLQAWQVFRLRRDFMATQFCQPVYEAFLEEAIASGRVDAPGFFDDPVIRAAYVAANWVGDAPSQIDPLKEIQAAELRLQVGVSDLKQETMELRGTVWEDVHEQQVREKKARVLGGLEAEAVQAAKPLGAKGSENAAPVGPTTPKPEEPADPSKPNPETPEQGDKENQ
jgi:lambda family phage portal protein